MRILTSILIIACLVFSCSKSGKREEAKTTVTIQEIQVSSPTTNVKAPKPKHGIMVYLIRTSKGLAMKPVPTNARGEYLDYTNYEGKVFRYNTVSETYKEVVK